MSRTPATGLSPALATQYVRLCCGIGMPSNVQPMVAAWNALAALTSRVYSSCQAKFPCVTASSLLLRFTGVGGRAKPRASRPRILLFGGMEAVNPQPHLRAAFGVRVVAQTRYKNSMSE